MDKIGILIIINLTVGAFIVYYITQFDRWYGRVSSRRHDLLVQILDKLKGIESVIRVLQKK